MSDDPFSSLSIQPLQKLIAQHEKQNSVFQSEIEKYRSSIPDFSHMFMGHAEELRKAMYPKIDFPDYAASILKDLDSKIDLSAYSTVQKQLADMVSSQYALAGLNENSVIQQALESLSPSSHVQDMLDKWKSDMEFVGRYPFAEFSRVTTEHKAIYDLLDNEEGVEESESNSEILLPEDVSERLVVVENLPIHIVNKIMDDPQIMREIDPRRFEYFIAHLVESLGFENVVVTPRSGDGGRDVIATKRVNGISLLFAFECKQYSPENKIQLDTLRSLLGTVSHGATKSNIGVLVTTSYFTSGCKDFIFSEASIDGKDFNDVVEWINTVHGKKNRR